MPDNKSQEHGEGGEGSRNRCLCGGPRRVYKITVAIRATVPDAVGERHWCLESARAMVESLLRTFRISGRWFDVQVLDHALQ